MINKVFNPDTYWEDRLKNIKGLEGVGFKKLGLSFNKWAYKVRKNVFLKNVKALNFNFSESTVLDIGSGTGFYIQIWNELLCSKITGVDITNTAVENLKKTFPNNIFFQSDIGDKNFNALNQYQTYHLVSAMDVLFHIVDDSRFEQAIANISTLIKKNGYFIYSDNFLNKKTFRGESQVLRTKSYLLEVFKRNGLEIELLKPFMYITAKPLETKNIFLKSYWWILENGLYAFPFMGNVIGLLIYPLELFLVSNSKNSPTTEFAIFKKIK